MKKKLIIFSVIFSSFFYAKAQVDSFSVDKNGFYINQAYQHLVKNNREQYFNQEQLSDEEFFSYKMILPVKFIKMRQIGSGYIIQIFITDEISEEYMLSNNPAVNASNVYSFTIENKVVSLLTKNKLWLDTLKKQTIEFQIKINKEAREISVSLRGNPTIAPVIFIKPQNLGSDINIRDYYEYVVLGGLYESEYGKKIVLQTNGKVSGYGSIKRYEILFKRRSKADNKIYTLIKFYRSDNSCLLAACNFDKGFLKVYNIVSDKNIKQTIGAIQTGGLYQPLVLKEKMKLIK